MNRDELFEILDIEDGKEFQYFENLADLFESSEDIGGDIIFELMKDVDLEDFAELCENYFDQLEDWIPDGETDFFMLEDSLFEKKEMDRERQVICEEIKMTKDSPDDLAHDTFIYNVFKGEPIGNSIIGTPTTLKGITHNVIRKYVEEQYVRESMVISVAGRFDADDVCAYFENRFSALGQSKPEAVTAPAEYKPTWHNSGAQQLRRRSQRILRDKQNGSQILLRRLYQEGQQGIWLYERPGDSTCHTEEVRHRICGRGMGQPL